MSEAIIGSEASVVLNSGSILNERYEIQSVLGEGGMGFVYLALDRVLGGKKVAVKEMAVHIHRDDERAQAMRMFRDEAMLLASLEHPRLVPVTDFFEFTDNAYLVMAYVDGNTLDETCGKRAVTMAEKLDWLDQICEVLEYLHGHKPPVLFRDLKPSNVMLDSRGHVRLIDFGIARTLETGSSTATFLKGAGTAEFAPVEQFGGRGTDARSDIYSLGATMYNLLTGVLPPISVDIISGEADPVQPRQINPTIPPSLERIIIQAMALKKEDRFQTVPAVRAAIAAARPDVPDEAVASAAPGGSPTIQPAGPPPVSPHATAKAPDELTPSAATLPRATPQPQTVSLAAPAAAPAAFPTAWSAPPTSSTTRLLRTALAAFAFILLSLGALLAAGWRPFGGHGRLQIASSPDGATVTLDGASRGQTPLTLSGIRTGVHTLHVEKDGLEPQDITFNVQGSDQIEARPGYNGKLVGSQLTLALPPKEGTILVNTDPSGVSVLVDGKKVADNVPNGKRIQVREGPHVLQVRAPGRQPSAPRTVNVAWKSMLVLEETLAVASGALLIDSNPKGAEIVIDGSSRGQTPLKVDVPPGKHAVEVRKSGYDSYARTVEVAAGGDRPVMAVLGAHAVARPVPTVVAVPAPVIVAAAPAPVATPVATPSAVIAVSTPPSTVTSAPVTPVDSGEDRVPAGGEGVRGQMLMALDMVASGKMTREMVLHKLSEKLQREGAPNLDFKLSQLERVLSSAQTLGPREYQMHRQRLADRMTMIVMSR